MEYIDEYFFFTCRPPFPLWRREAGECKQVGDDIRYISTFFHLPPMGHSMGHRHKHIFCAITELLMHQRKRIFCAIAAILQRSMENNKIKSKLLTFEMTADTSAVSFTCSLWEMIYICFALLQH